MASIHNRRGEPAGARKPRIGLALAGGGPLGGIYAVGALLALADSLEGIDFTDLDVHVGVSSGSFVAAALANGLSPAQMHRLFIGDGADAVLRPELFLRPALGEFARSARTLPRLAWRAARQYAANPSRRGAWASLATLSRAMPAGVFDTGALDDFLAALFAASGRSNDFRELPRKLYLIATHLDSGDFVAFGTRGLDHVPISRAIKASSALPGLFPPVEIDGAHYVDGALNKTMHASLALDEGIDLLFCINPLVPFDAGRAATRGAIPRDGVAKLRQGGLPLVLAQSLRAVIHSRMRSGMENYRRDYPRADVVLFEPAREDADVFFASLFSYAQRKRMCAIAYAATRASLRERSATLAPIFARSGIRILVERLDASDRHVDAALGDPRPLKAHARRRHDVRRTKRELAHVLDVLERFIGDGARRVARP